MSNPGIPGFDPEPRGNSRSFPHLGCIPDPFATFAVKYLILLQIRTKSLTAKVAKCAAKNAKKRSPIQPHRGLSAGLAKTAEMGGLDGCRQQDRS
jgi:hypothetical protein